MSETKPVGPKARPRWFFWLAGLAVFGTMVVLVGGLTGYASGLEQRAAREAQEASLSLRDQFDLGVEDLLAGRYEIARERFEYILSIDPSYSGALELLDEARLGSNQPTLTPSPTGVPTQEITPSATLDLSSLDGLFEGAQAANAQGNWDATIEILVTLIGESPTHRRPEVNQLLYTALRNRGLDKIFRGEREQGIYDLALAERITALDGQAQSWRSSAAFYSFANSYFGLDWGLSTEYFSQICAAGIWDGCFKYARSAWEYADLLFKDLDSCGSAVQYDASLRTADREDGPPTATQAFTICLTATSVTPTPSPTIDLSVTPTGTAGPSPTPTETPTLGPTATPTFTETATITLTP